MADYEPTEDDVQTAANALHDLWCWADGKWEAHAALSIALPSVIARAEAERVRAFLRYLEADDTLPMHLAADIMQFRGEQLGDWTEAGEQP